MQGAQRTRQSAVACTTSTITDLSSVQRMRGPFGTWSGPPCSHSDLYTCTDTRGTCPLPVLAKGVYGCKAPRRSLGTHVTETQVEGMGVGGATGREKTGEGCVHGGCKGKATKGGLPRAEIDIRTNNTHATDQTLKPTSNTNVKHRHCYQQQTLKPDPGSEANRSNSRSTLITSSTSLLFLSSFSLSLSSLSLLTAFLLASQFLWANLLLALLHFSYCFSRPSTALSKSTITNTQSRCPTLSGPQPPSIASPVPVLSQRQLVQCCGPHLLVRK